MRSDAPITSPKVSRSIVVSLAAPAYETAPASGPVKGTLHPHIYFRRGRAASLLSVSCCSCTTTAEDSDFTMEPITPPNSTPHMGTGPSITALAGTLSGAPPSVPPCLSDMAVSQSVKGCHDPQQGSPQTRRQLWRSFWKGSQPIHRNYIRLGGRST